MDQPRPGRIVTFHSFKGGTGRTMALANVAWILAAAGKKVLVVDWDLEAPGVHHFFEPFLDVELVMRRSGVIDMLREYEDGIVHDKGYVAEDVQRLAAVDAHTIAVNWDFHGGQLSIMPAGRQNTSYSPTLGERDWTRFFEELNGADFLEALRDDMRATYEYILIDSRAGRSDMVDVCTQHLPDVLVACYSLTNQAIEGAVRTAYGVETLARRGEPIHSIRILPVAMQVDHSVPTKADAGRRVAERAFSGLPSGMADAQRVRYFAVEIPYRADYAFEETLATFGDVPGDPDSLLAAYERLTAAITSGEVSSCPVLSNDERLPVLRRFDRAARLVETDVGEARKFRTDFNGLNSRGPGTGHAE
jgi:MinD-like ATPase involved in chromosome partitioning or flagellar assembly